MMPWLPPAVTSYSSDIDGLFTLILWITGFIFVVVQVALVYFAIRYRHREGARAFFIHGNMRAEVIWTVIPFVLVVLIAALSMGPWLHIRDYSRFPPADLNVHVLAKQFEWQVTYPGPDGRIGTGDDFTRRNRLDLPANRKVVVTLTAEDVIHSFFVPQFRVKQDAVPGMEIPVWFEVTEPGEYALGCAELCGLGHYRMKGTVTVHEAAAYEGWLQSGGRAALPPPATGVAVAGHTGHAAH